MHMVDKDCRAIYSEPEWTPNMLENQETEFYRNREEFQWPPRDSLTCLKEATSW